MYYYSMYVQRDHSVQRCQKARPHVVDLSFVVLKSISPSPPPPPALPSLLEPTWSCAALSISGCWRRTTNDITAVKSASTPPTTGAPHWPMELMLPTHITPML